LTHEVLPPPTARAVDEPTAWFLDYFSARELRRFLGMGPGAPVRDVRRAALMCGIVSVGAGALGARSVTNLAADPGAVGGLASGRLRAAPHRRRPLLGRQEDPLPG